MKLMKILFAMFLLLSLANSSAFADDAATRNYNQQKEFIKKYVLYAKGYIEKNGKIKSIADFNNAKRDAFNKGLYIFGFSCGTKKVDGMTLINPAKPERIYADNSDDPVVEKLIKAALANPDGVWVSYDWENPTTKQVQQKESYIIFLPKQLLCIGSGVYAPQN